MNNDEYTGFLMWIPCYCLSWIYKPTKKSRYFYSLLVYNENHKHTIQYTKNINDTASLVEAVSTIQNECKYTGHFKIQFVSCSCANVDRGERILKELTSKWNWGGLISGRACIRWQICITKSIGLAYSWKTD